MKSPDQRNGNGHAAVAKFGESNGRPFALTLLPSLRTGTSMPLLSSTRVEPREAARVYFLFCQVAGNLQVPANVRRAM